MKCPKCSSDHVIVVDSRPVDGGIKRRRACLDCGYRHNTYEILEDSLLGLKRMMDGILDIIPDRILNKKF